MTKSIIITKNRVTLETHGEDRPTGARPEDAERQVPPTPRSTLTAGVQQVGQSRPVRPVEEQATPPLRSPAGRSVRSAKTLDPLANPAWHALTGRQAHLADVAGPARRFLRDVSFFSAVDRLDDAGWAALARLAGPGGTVVLARDAVPTPPPGWLTARTIRSQQMVAESLPPASMADYRLGIQPLTPAGRRQVLDLVELSRPGPFLARTVELGGYIGIAEGGRLIAMAGERLRPAGHTEISAVCTHPDHRGQGLAAAVTRHVARAILDRGEIPFLHVSDDNHTARRLYERLGFTRRRTIEFVMLRTPQGDGG